MFFFILSWFLDNRPRRYLLLVICAYQRLTIPAVCLVHENNARMMQQRIIDEKRKMLAGISMMMAEDPSCSHFESRWRVPETEDSVESGLDICSTLSRYAGRLIILLTVVH